MEDLDMGDMEDMEHGSQTWMAKAKGAMGHVSEGLEKVRAKEWAKPLGKALKVSGKIVKSMDFLPGAGIIGGALSIGATLLNPEPTIKDLQKDLKEIQRTLADGAQNKIIIDALQSKQTEIEGKIANPAAEIRADFEEVKSEMKSMMEKVSEFNEHIEDDMIVMKDKISQTYQVVTDHRYKVSRLTEFPKLEMPVNTCECSLCI
jgi:gas vesicle protein